MKSKSLSNLARNQICTPNILQPNSMTQTHRLKNRLTPICPTRGDLPFAFRLRAKKQQLGPGPPHAPQITKTHPNAPQQGVKCSRTFGQNLGGEKGEHSTSTCPSLVRKRGNSMKMRHEPRGTNVGKSTMKTGN